MGALQQPHHRRWPSSSSPAVAAWRGYEYWQARKAAEAGAAYEAALKLSEDGKHTEAEEAFGKLAAQGTSGYRMLARVRQAAELGAIDPKAGVAAYDAIAGEPGPPLIRELASIRAAIPAGRHGEATTR